VGAKQGAPGSQAPFIRKCIADEAVEDRRRIGCRRYLHLHLHWRTVVATASISGTAPKGRARMITAIRPAETASQRSVRDPGRRRPCSANDGRPRNERLQRAPCEERSSGQAPRHGSRPRGGDGPPRGIPDPRRHRDHRTSSIPPGGTSRSVPGSGAWTARRKATRSGARPRPRT
jgi:hypothetical protein